MQTAGRGRRTIAVAQTGLYLAGWGVLRLDRRELDQEVRRLI